MDYLGISLQRISLGALIIALGLLVDDAMIAVEMMVARLEVGDTLRKAATYVYTSTAFPMLTGTLVTVAGFIPIGLNSSAAGEFTFTLFVVIAVSLLVSWIVAVLFTPLLGVTLLPDDHEEASRASRAGSPRAFAGSLRLRMRWRWLTIGATLALFALSVVGMRFVQQQFFPDLRPAGADRRLDPAAEHLDRRDQGADGPLREERWPATPISSTGRPMSARAPCASCCPSTCSRPTRIFGQIVIVTKGLEVRDRRRRRTLQKPCCEKTSSAPTPMSSCSTSARRSAARSSTGSAGRTSSRCASWRCRLARRSGGQSRTSATSPTTGTNRRGSCKVEVLQDKARQLGVTSEDIASALNGTCRRHGRHAGARRHLSRRRGRPGPTDARAQLDRDPAATCRLPARTASTGAAAAVATFRYELEQPGGLAPRPPADDHRQGRHRRRRSSRPPIVEPAGARGRRASAQACRRATRVEVGGTVEESAKGQAPIVAVVPLMLFVMATILMIQLQSFQRLFLVVGVAPLGLIGVVAALLPSGAPLGFVAILGVLALIGILIRNSVILIVQIESTCGRRAAIAWDAVDRGDEHRMRPIMLTAAAASLGLIPIAREVFWGPMAYAMMGGIIVGTALTLLFLPALYVAWFRIKEPGKEETTEEAASPLHAQSRRPATGGRRVRGRRAAREGVGAGRNGQVGRWWGGPVERFLLAADWSAPACRTNPKSLLPSWPRPASPNRRSSTGFVRPEGCQVHIAPTARKVQ